MPVRLSPTAEHDQADVHQDASADSLHPTQALRLRLGGEPSAQVRRLLQGSASPLIKFYTENIKLSVVLQILSMCLCAALTAPDLDNTPISLAVPVDLGHGAVHGGGHEAARGGGRAAGRQQQTLLRLAQHVAEQQEPRGDHRLRRHGPAHDAHQVPVSGEHLFAPSQATRVMLSAANVLAIRTAQNRVFLGIRAKPSCFKISGPR